MALKNPSLFLYGYEVTPTNQYVDFANNVSQTNLTAFTATLSLGFYSLTSLLTEIVRAMNAADPANIYTATATRTIMGGTQNRVTVSTSGSFLTLFFGTGVHSVSSVSSLIGFLAADQTGATSYTGTATTGTSLQPTFVGYTFLSPTFVHRVFGSVNVSAIGEKEATVFSIQKFWQVEFKYEPETKIINQYSPLFDWMIQQRKIEFTPDITDPNTFYQGTLEKTSEDGKALAYRFPEMLPQFPGLYTTGLLVFRQTILTGNFST